MHLHTIMQECWYLLIFFSFDSFCVYVVGIELVCGDKMHLATAASVLHFTLEGYGDEENVFILKKICSIFMLLLFSWLRYVHINFYQYIHWKHCKLQALKKVSWKIWVSSRAVSLNGRCQMWLWCHMCQMWLWRGMFTLIWLILG